MRGKQLARTCGIACRVRQTRKRPLGTKLPACSRDAGGGTVCCRDSDNKAAQALGGAAQVAGAVGAVGTAADMLSESANNAEAMAEAYGVPVPNIKKKSVACAIVPVSGFSLRYTSRNTPRGSQETKQEKIALAAEQIDTAANALAPVCERGFGTTTCMREVQKITAIT